MRFMNGLNFSGIMHRFRTPAFLVFLAVVGAHGQLDLQIVLDPLRLQYRSESGHYYALYSGGLDHFEADAVALHDGTENTVVRQFPLEFNPDKGPFYRLEEFALDAINDLDGDGMSDIFELADRGKFDPLDPTDAWPQEEGSYFLFDRNAFEAFSERSNFPGAVHAREIKFLITDVNTESPQFYFMNTRNFPFHYYFASESLNSPLNLNQFNAATYFNDNRSFIAGSLVAHDSYESDDHSLGIYTLEFWPTDNLRFAHVSLSYELLIRAMPFAEGRIFYHAPSESQRELYEQEIALYEASDVQVIATEILFENIAYVALNPGISYGRLKRAVQAARHSSRDIVIFDTIPNTLSHVSGIITTLPQTPLSHINLKAKQNQIPNAYIKNINSDPDVQSLLGQFIRLEVDSDGYSIVPASQSEVDAYFESQRPENPQFPFRDLSVTTVQLLGDVGFLYSDSIGAKAANVAELARILPTGMAPDGFAVPFYFYDEFMKLNDFYNEAIALEEIPGFSSDPAIRNEALSQFRERIKDDGELPQWMIEELHLMQESFPDGQSIRCRSSTNNEDLENFNGAGLYDSFTHHPDEGHISKSIKQVWASLWTYRAYEEREFHRIDHSSTAMAVLVHPNYSEELANGVAVTKNIYDINWRGYYVNVQVGEDLVTNPEEESIPEEFLVANLAGSERYEIQYIRSSNQIEPGTRLLDQSEVFHLADQMEKIQTHFKSLYGSGDINFAMEIEFKITAEGDLSIKQARPWID